LWVLSEGNCNVDGMSLVGAVPGVTPTASPTATPTQTPVGDEALPPTGV
jgi:hypothetical protein